MTVNGRSPLTARETVRAGSGKGGGEYPRGRFSPTVRRGGHFWRLRNGEDIQRRKEDNRGAFG